VRDIAAQFCYHGFLKQIYLSGHGANKLGCELGFYKVWERYPAFAPAYRNYWTEAGLTSIHHADKGETEIAMAVGSPVYMDRVRDWSFKKPWHLVNSRFAYQPESGGVNGTPSTADPAEGERMREQIVWTQAEYHRLWRDLAGKAERHGLEEAFRAVPSQPRTLRFPYGTCSAESLRTVNTLGLAAIQWDVVSADAARGQTAEAMARHVLREVKPGSIVVFHANGRGNGTAAALPNILHGLRERGYRFVTVSELLDAGEPDAKPECYELRPGDNLRYDRLFGEGTE